MMRARVPLLCALLLAPACTPARPSLPSGDGQPFPAIDAAYAEAIESCRSARSIVAELGLSGRAGGTRLRGTINAGIAAPGDIRLEGVAFGRTLFILAGRNGEATLVLTREARVVRREPPAAIVEALTGVALTPAELVAAVAGCGLGAATPANGRSFGRDWAAADAGGGVTYLRRIDRRWRVAGAVRGQVQVLYGAFASGLPSTVHVKTGTVADIALRVSQLEINTAIDPKAFEVVVPDDALPLTLDELRRSGPLGDRGSEPR